MNQRLIIGGIVVASASLTTFIVAREGNEYLPYQDTGGVWSVCAGVTGKNVVPGRPYSEDECTALNSGAIEHHGKEVLQCMQGITLKQHEYDSLASLAYNVGTGNVCFSCLPAKFCLGDLVRKGRMAEACERILAYSKVRIRGVLRDCRDPQWNCRGVWLRRVAERDMCLGRPPSEPRIPSLGVEGA